MFFAIKFKDFNVWLGKKHLSYFITDDEYFTFCPEKKSMQLVLNMGVPEKRRRVFSSTDEIRRSLRCCNKETVVKTIPPFEVLTKGDSLGKFSNYVVVDLVNDNEYSLDDVLNGLV
jgi:hypothetical protein